MMQLKENGHKLLNDMLSFMAISPGGICLTELKLIGKRMITAQNQEIQTDISLYDGIIREIS